MAYISSSRDCINKRKLTIVIEEMFGQYVLDVLLFPNVSIEKNCLKKKEFDYVAFKFVLMERANHLQVNRVSAFEPHSRQFRLK